MKRNRLCLQNPIVFFAAGFFVGQVMKLSKGKADPKIVGRIVAEKLAEA